MSHVWLLEVISKTSSTDVVEKGAVEIGAVEIGAVEKGSALFTCGTHATCSSNATRITLA
jgi:hypothetical protein